MDPSSTGGFTNLLNSSTSSPEFQGPQSGYNQQYPNFPPPHFDHDFRPPPYRPIQSHYPHHFNPFGVQLGFQQFRGTSSYHGTPYHEGGLFGGIGGSGSRADESESPISVPQPSHGVPAINEEQSESSPEEENKKSGCRSWSKPMNLRLVRAWLNNSNDPIQGVDKKYDHYWKDVAKEYNKHSPKEERRSAAVLKNHWNRYPIVMKFNHCWNRMKNTHASGESDDQIMVRAHAVFSNENSDKPFLLEYWWREIRTKLVLKYIVALLARRQQKHKKREREVLSHCSEGYLSNDIVNSFNDFQLKKLQAIEKMAEATSEHAKAIAKQAAANEEKTRDKKLNKYLKLVTVDTANFSAEQKAGMTLC
ncbi:unnamed protein product [Miscanthus lutarioriparius]|uniref:No apical meristem-associated C-terminal domain-containing protein n=1 Tax=Miscanthus lutarioriparius TaxID=422564 RepID=A0A811PFC0_9POAL|nr:unnamed protein product [Miscanthus lutarioriparius]